MKSIALLPLAFASWHLLHAAGPVDLDARAMQRAGKPLGSVASDAGNANNATVSASASDTGTAIDTTPGSSFSGDVGLAMSPRTGERFAWEVGKHRLGRLSANARRRAAQNAPPAPDGMVLIPAGSFTMGDTIGDGWVNERPTHTVAVSAFYMDRYEVTQTLWDEVYAWALGHGYRFDNPGLGKAPNHPVHTVNWYDAVKWCNARSEKEGLAPAYYTNAALTKVYRTGQVDVQNDWVKWTAGYRLPTEAEWERAARGGVSGRRFPWGDTISQSQANYDSSSYYRYDISPSRGFDPLYRVGEFPYTSPVGSFAPNEYGLDDLIGNVWEWCWDWYGGYGSDSQADPRGPASGPGRVVRGGSWNTYAWYCRLANRDYYRPVLCDYDYGFRCLLPPSQPGEDRNRGLEPPGAG